MRLKFTIPVLLFGACTSVDEDTTPSWFEGWSPVDDVPVQEVVATHFFSADLPEGVMTFGAISTEEEAVAITSGVASYTDGVSTVYASDGTSLYRLEPDTLTLTHLSEFEDASGPVDGITSMHRVRIDGEEILFVRTTDTIRLLDVSALVLSSPLALLDVHPTTGAVDRLAPKSLMVVPSFQVSFASPYVALGDDGLLRLGREMVFQDQIVVSFQQLPARIKVCSTNEDIAFEHVLAPTFSEASTLAEEHLLFVSEGRSWELDRNLCVIPLEHIVDQNEAPLHPIVGFDVDFDNDGVDAVMWVHQ